jgi:hypothetical protein
MLQVLFYFCIVLIFNQKGFAQNNFSLKTPPLSISENWDDWAIMPPYELAAPDLEALKLEDQKRGWEGVRFAAPLAVAPISPRQIGVWRTLGNGSRVWRLRLKVAQARGLAFELDSVSLGSRSTLHFFSADGKQIYQIFQAGKIQTNIIKGEEVWIEYYQSILDNNTTASSFLIKRIFYDYKSNIQNNVGRVLNTENLGDALACEINVNCTQGANFQQEKRGIVRILMNFREGLGWCSGSLLANTRRDSTPFLLSAYHCQDGFTPNYDLWVFHFNYESPNCQNPASEPMFQSLQGCTLKSSWQNTDFLLLQLNENLTTTHNAYLNGWSRDTSAAPTNTTMIHHPQGDIKKISIDRDPATVQTTAQNWSNNVITPAYHHLRFIFDDGTAESGSSGSPIFDQNRRVVGQLHGADFVSGNACRVNWAMCGRFAVSWNGGGTPQTRLKDWLDPTNSNALTANGMIPPSVNSGGGSSVGRVSGRVRLTDGRGVANVTVQIGTQMGQTDVNGNYIINNIPLNTLVNVQLTKHDELLNGLEATDMLLLRRNLLSLSPFTNAYQYLAADLNGDNEANVTDILLMRRLILGLANSANIPIWRFYTTEIQLSTANPFVSVPQVLEVRFSGDVPNFDFIAIKAGDVNNSVETGR